MIRMDLFHRLVFIFLAILLHFRLDPTHACQCPSCSQVDTYQRCECCIYRQFGKRSEPTAANVYIPDQDGLLSDTSELRTTSAGRSDTDSDIRLPPQSPQDTAVFEYKLGEGSLWELDKKQDSNTLVLCHPSYLPDTAKQNNTLNTGGSVVESILEEDSWAGLQPEKATPVTTLLNLLGHVNTMGYVSSDDLYKMKEPSTESGDTLLDKAVAHAYLSNLLQRFGKIGK